MKYIQFTKQFAGILMGIALFASCKKSEKVTQIGDAGQTVVKLIGGGSKIEPELSKKAIDFVNTSQDITAADIRRDVAKSADLAKQMTVIVTDDTAAFRIYNDDLIANGNAPLEILPSTWYSLNIPRVGGEVGTGAGGTYTVVLNGGEFAKQIIMTLPDATVLDPSSTYGMAFTITSADADGNVSVGQRSIILTIGAKNKYDGDYHMNGIHNRPGYQFFYDVDMQMITTGASSVIYYWPDAGSVGHPIATSASNTLSWYGPTVDPHVDFNPVTNLATNIYGLDPAGPPISMNNGANYPNAPDPAHPTISRYDDGTKTMYLYWRYNANPDRAFFDTLVYTGPR